MAKLTAEQQKQLDDLTALAEAPDEEPKGIGQMLNFTIDLSDENAVARALKLGILKPSDVDGDDDDEDPEEEPEPDEQPRRRLTGADKLMGK